MKKCNLCENINQNKIFKTNFPSFRHLDFKKISSKTKYLKCSKCQSISVYHSKKKENIENMFKSKKYSHSNQTNQKKYFNTNLLYRSEIQSEFIAKHLKDNSNILDVGCFDGRLLSFLNKKLNKSSFTGFEINKKLKKIFPKKKNFFFVENLDNLKYQKFDAVILSHSIMYFKKLNFLLKKINYLLNEKGKLFIQIPDIVKNPLNLLMGDQRSIITVNSMKNLCKLSGFKIIKIEKRVFKREILFVITKNNLNVKKNLMFSDNTLENTLNFINKFKLRLIKKFLDKKYYILGTTVNAAFVHELFKKKILFVLDENNDKKIFRKLKVFKPKNFNFKFNTIVPLIEKKLFVKKLQKKYKHNFLLI